MQMIPKKDHGPAPRYFTGDIQNNRKERRMFAHMSPGRRTEEARAMYNEMKAWAVARNDEAMAYNLVTKFYPYCRMDKPLPMSKRKSEELRKLYDDTRQDIIDAHYEDVAAMEDAKFFN